MKGLFITLEGPEGSGKTTQIRRINDYFVSRNIECMMVREPGGTEIGNAVRHLVLDPNFTEMALRTEILLYAASRAQLVEEKIRPALSRGVVVLCDRFVDSSIAYQGYGSVKGNIQDVVEINKIATGGLKPDRTYLLDISVDLLEERLGLRGIAKDRIEQKEREFHIRVRDGYELLARSESSRFCVIDATKDVDRVFDEMMLDLDQLMV